MSWHQKPGDEPVERDQFSVLIECPKCGEKGVATWEENKHTSVSGPEPTLIRLSSEFYERVSKRAPHVIELVCRKCGTAQIE
jgi:hypothetical protein